MSRLIRYSCRIFQLGHGDDHCSGVPRVIEALKPGDGREGGGAVIYVSAGGIHSAAVLEGGGVYTWGGSSYGQVLTVDRVSVSSYD